MTLDGKRILVVEDEYLIAADLKRLLAERGAEVVGPVGDLRKGLALARQGRLDAAVLDINLEGDASFPIADILASESVPFVFLTGYDVWSLPNGYASTPTLAKPYTRDAVMEAVERLCRPVAPSRDPTSHPPPPRGSAGAPAHGRAREARSRSSGAA